ncbi:hypothetical protein TNCV_351391 [Trichonephila clavipes]|nr:hypothetical protein TNCV_351391 [Trichonephila clavipes]
MVKVTDSLFACHEFESNISEYPPNRGSKCALNSSRPKRPPFVGGMKVRRSGCQLSYTRALSDGRRNFKPWSIDNDDTLDGIPPLSCLPHYSNRNTFDP